LPNHIILTDFLPEMTLEDHGNLLLENILNLGVGTLFMVDFPIAGI
jgi:hypothetical protein